MYLVWKQYLKAFYLVGNNAILVQKWKMTVHQSIVSLAKVMYLGAMWRWGRVGDILADVLSYRSCLTREREREGEGGLFMPHSDTQPSFNQTYKTKQTKPNQTKPTKLTKPNNHNATRERGGSQQLKFEQPNQTKPITYHRMTTMSWHDVTENHIQFYSHRGWFCPYSTFDISNIFFGTKLQIAIVAGECVDKIGRLGMERGAIKEG